MGLLEDLLRNLTGGAQQASRQVPVGQRLTPQDISRLSPGVQHQAQIYNDNPRDPRVAHVDPAMFGYAPDTTAEPPQSQIKYPRFNPQTGFRQSGPSQPGFNPTVMSYGRFKSPGFPGMPDTYDPRNSEFEQPRF